MYLVKENDVYKREREVEFSSKERITFKLGSKQIYEKPEYDWYMSVALEKSDLVKEDRHLLLPEVFLAYRWAIREGYNHNLDPHLITRYSHPRNRNTVAGIIGYTNRIKKAADKEMENILDNEQ